MKRLIIDKYTLDKIDTALLTALAGDARRSVADLARQVGLSAPSVSERLKRLEESGVIKRYTIDVDPIAFGRPLSVWLRVSPNPGKLKKVVEVLRSLAPVVQCDRVTGDDCFFARAHLRDVDELERLIDKLIMYATTNTAVIQSPPVERRLPPFDVSDDTNTAAA